MEFEFERTTEFGDVKRGECFLDEVGYLYMKFGAYFDKNAIDLHNGNLVHFGDEHQVTPVKVTAKVAPM